ncbi:hypothetical protein LX32DRAFT_646857 [Colletotrichum zoysiae]|uniref:Secreted protein n=1 Tax=Colletotrichum zoysiae TaxID=1216348 RepID=A0AAD9H396_9PEZI|nr:hypothetical protein LX32DRAFT_646857 [Colletotrichum zoysiae]
MTCTCCSRLTASFLPLCLCLCLCLCSGGGGGGCALLRSISIFVYLELWVPLWDDSDGGDEMKPTSHVIRRQVGRYQQNNKRTWRDCSLQLQPKIPTQVGTSTQTQTGTDTDTR